MTATTTPAVDRRVAEAECYVRTRFYPPLPYQYGEYAVQAVDACNSGEDTAEIMLDPELHVHPAKATRDEAGSVSISAADLIDALRLWHMVEEDEAPEEDPHSCPEFAVDKATTPSFNGSFEVWTECERCGKTWDHAHDSVF